MAEAVLDGWRSVAEVSAAYGNTCNTCRRADPVGDLSQVGVVACSRTGSASW